METRRPLLAITMGDPAGVGPEVVAKALDRADVREVCRPLVVGDARCMEDATRVVGTRRSVRAVRAPSEMETDDSLEVLDLANLDVAKTVRGQVSPEAGRAAYEYVRHAVQLALSGETVGVVTAPINKEALHAAGLPYAGHTEILAEQCGAKGVAMLLVIRSVARQPREHARFATPCRRPGHRGAYFASSAPDSRRPGANGAGCPSHRRGRAKPPRGRARPIWKRGARCHHSGGGNRSSAGLRRRRAILARQCLPARQPRRV